MTSNKINWKSSEILKVFGTTIRQGTFTGGKATESGVIARDNPTNFTPSYIASLYENINTHVPFYLDHSTGVRTPIGYAYKFGVTDMLDDIKYNGFVFDQAAKQKIVLEGYDSVSPEIEELTSEDGKTTAILKAICFTRAPAIDGLELAAEPIVFSKPESNDNTGDNSMATEETVTTPEVTPPATTPATETAKPPVQDVAPVVQAAPKATPVPSSSGSDDLAAQLNELKAKLEQSENAKDELLNVQLSGVTSELKALGVDDPAAIVRGLPKEQQIAVLSKMKGTVVKTKPMSAPTTATTPAEDNASRDKAISEALADLGVKPEYYKKLVGA